MSYLVTTPEYVSAAATDLANIGSTIRAANASASGPTTAMVAAGADEVSAAVSAVFSEYGQAYQALSAQAEAFHQQFVQLMTAAGGTYAAAEAANIAPLQTVQQELSAAVNAPTQVGSALAGANLGGLTRGLTSGLGNLAGLGSAASLGNLVGLTGLGGLTNLGGLANVGNLTNLGGLGNLGGITNLGGLTNPAGLANLGGLTGGLANLNVGGDLSRLANVPYNLFADVANIPYYESLALQEYAYALGPAGSVGGVPGWIPPGATIANGGVKMIDGLPYYALGGTGSWEYESMGNTWGWDDGNWPQVDALLHFALPFPFTESLAYQFETFAQAEFIDGTAVSSQFMTADPLAYLGGWLHGATPISSLLAGTTFPNTVANTIGMNSPTGVVNVGPNGDLVNWAGQPAHLEPMAPLNAIGANLTATPAQDPIMLPNLGNVATSAIQLEFDEINDFNPFETGSFLYWGAPNLYSVPSALGGTLQDFTNIPNQFPLANYGAEPISGYTTGPSSLLPGLQEGGQYLQQGLFDYLNPEIYGQALNTDLTVLTHPGILVADAPLTGYLGLG